MDVSVKRSAAEFGANVIARSVDRATTIATDDSNEQRQSQPPAMNDDFATDAPAA
jgi:hypothetical protein